jgi:hypothetical protein
MLLRRALASLLLLGGPVLAFNPQAKQGFLKKANKKLEWVAGGLAAGVLAVTVALPSGPALAADSLVLGTPLETKLSSFGAASYPVFNSITDVAPLADKFITFIDSKVKPADSADVVQKAVDGLLAIPDAKVSEYAGILKQVVYKGVSKDSCVTLGGSEAFSKKLQASTAVQSIDPAKFSALKTKFNPANSAVPVGKNGICLPGSVEASEKLWVAQAELTFSMPKAEASALVGAVKKAGASTPRPSILALVPSAEGIFSKSGEAIKMVAAGKDVEPTVIATVAAALQ